MPNPATTHFAPADAAWPDHTGLCSHPDDAVNPGHETVYSRPGDAPTLGNGAGCFHPDDDRPDHSRVCFHPDDDRRDHSGVCFHPGDARRAQSSVYFRPTDDNTASKCFHASSSDVSHPCFRPADDEPVAIGTGRPVSPCHHPSEPGDHTGRTESLAADLHRTLTEFEQQHLAALSSRS